MAIKTNWGPTHLPNRNGRETGMEHVENLLTSVYNFSIYNSTANEYTLSYLSSLSDFLKG